jgi:hypothetical protein
MGQFKIGDSVTDGVSSGVVTDVVSTIRIKWDFNGEGGWWPARFFSLVSPPARAFAVGDYVRTLQGFYGDEPGGVIGMVIDDDGDAEDEAPYTVALFIEGDDNEEVYSASEIIPWIPEIGDRVLEIDSDDYELGTVVGWSKDDTAAVLWDNYALTQDWLFSDLEPADEHDEEDEYEVGFGFYTAA